MVAAENGVKMAAEDVGSPSGVKRGVVEKADASENTGLKCGGRSRDPPDRPDISYP